MKLFLYFLAVIFIPILNEMSIGFINGLFGLHLKADIGNVAFCWIAYFTIVCGGHINPQPERKVEE